MMRKPLQINAKDFIWATGIEDTFVPQVRPGFRRLDEYELTQHYQQWKEDLDLAASLGVKALRWGIPWYQVQPKPGVFDWSWTDQVLDYMVNAKGLTPILDLVHYGTPLWLDNSFIHAAYPALVAEFARAVAERYKSLSPAYTPLNEPFICAEMCGMKGAWPPYLTGEDGFVKLITALSRGIVLTVQALRSADPTGLIVHVEAVGHFWSEDASPDVRRKVEQRNLLKSLGTDLCSGLVDERHPLFTLLEAYGVSSRDLEWFRENSVSFDIFGANFYPWSYGEVRPLKDGRLSRLRRQTSGTVIGKVLQEAWERYKIPVMVTETSAGGSHARRARWMDESIEAVHRLRCDGVPVVGYTWFPMFSMFDWKYRTGRKPLDSYTINLGLYECTFNPEGVYCRSATTLVERYQEHMQRPIPPLPSDSPG